MSSIDLKSALKTIGDSVVEDVKGIIKTEMLPTHLKEKAATWALNASAELVAAAEAKVAGDTAAYEKAIREVQLYGQAARAVATAEVLIGITAAEREGRRVLARAIDTGLNIGLKVLLAAVL